MKRGIYILLFIGILLGSFFYFNFRSLSTDDLPPEWKQLTNSMTRAEVLKALGENAETKEQSAFQEKGLEIWDHLAGKKYYQLTIHYGENKAEDSQSATVAGIRVRGRIYGMDRILIEH